MYRDNSKLIRQNSGICTVYNIKSRELKRKQSSPGWGGTINVFVYVLGISTFLATFSDKGKSD